MEVFLCRTVAEQGTKPRPQMRGLSAGYGAAATSVVPSHSVRTSYARHPTVAVTRAPTGQPDLRATQSRLVVIAQAACTSIQLLCIASHRWATPVTFRRAAPSSRSGAMGRARDAPPRWPLLLALCAAARLPRPAEARAPCVTEPETDATLVRATPGVPPWRRRERTCAPRGCCWVHTHASGAESAPEAQTLRQGYAQPMALAVAVAPCG